MSSLNKCDFIGNVTKEPEIRHTKDNKAIANFSLACNEEWKDKQGNKQQKCEFVNFVVFGGIAGVIEKYVHKGDKLFMSGKLQTRKWKDKTGNDRYSTEVVLDGFNGNMIMIGSQQPSNDYKQDTPSGEAEVQDDAYGEEPPF